MSIKGSRNIKTFITDSQYSIGNNDTPTNTVISFSHLKHVDGVKFLKSEKRDQKFTHLRKKITGEFYSKQITPWWFFAVDYLNTAKSFNKFINKFFVDTLNLKFEHILRQTGGSRFSSFANEKAPITINKSGQIDEIIPSNLRKIQSCAPFTHQKILFYCTSMVQYVGFNVHRERLSEKTSNEEAIVCSA